MRVVVVEQTKFSILLVEMGHQETSRMLLTRINYPSLYNIQILPCCYLSLYYCNKPQMLKDDKILNMGKQLMSS